MINMRLDDPHIVENFKSIRYLLKIGFPEEKLQELYDSQVEEDLKEESKS